MKQGTEVHPRRWLKAEPQPFEAIASRHFGGWLADNGVSLACTTTKPT